MKESCRLSENDISVNKVVCNGVERESGKRMDLQFPRDIPSVCDNGVYGDEQVRSNLFVAHSLHKTHDNFSLPF